MKGINKQIQENTCNLVGEENVNYFGTKTIAIVGLGGVGCAALNALARSGFMNFVLIDSSRVEYANLNRQIIYTAGDVDLRKVDVAGSFLGSLTDGIVVDTIYTRLTDENVEEVLGNFHIDYLIEAVDAVEPKVTLIKYAKAHDIPIIVTGGLSGRVDPTLIEITPLSRTTNDEDARKIRKACLDASIDPSTVMCIHSREHKFQSANEDKPSYMVMVPTSAGLFACYYIVQHFIERLEDEKEK